jgi:hypothetical protein
MSAEKFETLVGALCKELGIADVDTVRQRGVVEVGGYHIMLTHLPSDEKAMYVNFYFGCTSAGRTLAAFQLMLQSNLTVYGQDQAQLGLQPDHGGVLLIVRVPFTDEVDGPYLAETIEHYSEHGRYWIETLHGIEDEQYTPTWDVPVPFAWMKA